MTFKFAQNQSVAAEDINDVPAELRPFYAPGEGGTLTLKPELAEAANAWDGMAQTNENVRAEIKLAKKGKVDLSPLADFGSTPEDILATFNARTKEMSDVIEAKKGAVDPEKMRKQMTEAFTDKEKAFTARIEGLQSQLYNQLVTNDLHKAISQHKGDTHILLPILEKQVKIQDQDGKQIPVVLDDDGDVRRGATGLPMSMSELVEAHKKNPLYKKLFEADVVPGSGPPSLRTPNGVQPNSGPTTAGEDIAAGLAERM